MKNRTLFFGEGLFETFRVHLGRKLAFVEDHLDRMAEGCTFFGFPFSREKAIEALRLALQEIPVDGAARLRLNLICYGENRVEKTDFETSWAPLPGPGTGPDADRGVQLDFAPFQRLSSSPLVRFKTTSYLENIFVLTWARSRGLFDALFTNERNEVTEGSITNVFFVERGRVITPPLAAGLLPGITRRHVFSVAGTLHLPIAECRVMPSDLDRFDGAFVTNSVVGILPVSNLGDTAYEVPETVRDLRDGYGGCVRMSARSLDSFNERPAP